MDGVIFDSEHICSLAWHRVAPEFALQHVEATLRACTGMNKFDTRHYLLQTYGADFPVQAFLERTSAFFHTYVAAHGLPLKPYVREILEYLKQKKVYTCTCIFYSPCNSCAGIAASSAA